MVYCRSSVRELRFYNSINIFELLNVNIDVTFHLVKYNSNEIQLNWCKSLIQKLL